MNSLVCALLIGAVALCAIVEAGRPMAGASGMMFFQSSGGQGQVWRFGGKPTAMRRSSAPDCGTKSAVDAVALKDTVGEVVVPTAAAAAEQSAAIEDFRRDAEEIEDDGEQIVADDSGKTSEEADVDSSSAEDDGDESDREDDDDEAVTSIFPKMPAFPVGKMPAFFPMHFGRTTGGAIAVANSYSKNGAAISLAAAHGSPATRRQQRNTGKPTPTL